MVLLAPMDDFQDEDTQVVEVGLEEPAVSRTRTRRRKSSYIGLVPLTTAGDLPPGTELYGPSGQKGYIAGHTRRGLVIFDMQGGGVGNDRSYTTFEAWPDAFIGWRTAGGALL